jgi:phage shock protein A
MDAKLQYVVLWPKNPANKVRRIKFACKGVEVISGWSQKGKSALIHIVDYCLGSEKCAIPVGKVRDMVEWFGVVMVLPKGKRLLVARRNPGDNADSADMMWLESRKLVLPEVPTKTDGRESVIERLNQLAGLPSRGAHDEELSSFDGPPSFRDMAAFNFQPQHIIANPYTLFFKADTSVHREKLVRSVLPYVLGSVDSETLNKQAQLRRVELDLKLRKEELEQCKRISEMWKAKLQGLFSTARNFNLLPEDAEPKQEWSVGIYIEHLRLVPEHWKTHPIFKDVPGLSRRASREITLLNQEEIRLNRGIQDSERKLRKLDSLRSSVADYNSALDKQQERLLPVGWLAAKLKGKKECPFCGNLSDKALNESKVLASAAQNLGEILSSSSAANESLDTESRRLIVAIEELQSQLASVEARISAAEQKHIELKNARSRRDFLNNYVGQLQTVLASIEEGSSEGKLQKKVDELSKKVEALLREVNPGAIRSKTQAALKKIEHSISVYSELLGVEHNEQKWTLDDKNLTLMSKTAKRVDYLWEIGSAANWMGFHVAALLALHEHFRTVRHNPVPKFLMIDQPSQAFFPEGLSATKSIAARQKIHPRFSDDMDRLRKLFKTLSEAIDRTKSGLQIILLEHAEPITWKGIRHFSMPDGEWRESAALIPANWV